MVHHAGHSFALKRKIRAVLQIIAQNFPQQLATNFPGLTYVPFVKAGVRALPIIIKTHLLHASVGSVTAYAILWYTDSPHPSAVAESSHSRNFEYFFYTPDGRQHRSLYVHEIIAVEPNCGDLSSFVGKWFSSFNASQDALGSSVPGWLNWFSVDEEGLSMAAVARTVGFRNHPEILEATLEDLSEVLEPWDPIADWEPERTGPQSRRVHPNPWPMRDAMAAMCVNECNPFDCNPSMATKRLRLPISTLYHAVSEVIKVKATAGVKNIDDRELKRSVEAYHCCFDTPMSPRVHVYGPLPSKLKRPKNTLDLERERPIIATDVAITMVLMDKVEELRCISQARLSASPLLNSLRQRTPLMGFFRLFGKIVLCVTELQQLMQANPGEWCPSSSPPLSEVVLLDNHRAHLLHTTCIVPLDVYQEFEALQSGNHANAVTPVSTLSIEEI